MDERVRRTRELLGDALVALMHEKPFAEIKVQDVLDRARVSRSTFYTHYSDKEDLFLSDAEDFFEMVAFRLCEHGTASKRLVPVCEMLAHVAEVREFFSAMLASGKGQEILDLGEGYFARGIEQRLATLTSLPASRRVALSVAFAGAFMALLSWWVNQGSAFTPEQMDELFHRMVWSGVEAF